MGVASACRSACARRLCFVQQPPWSQQLRGACCQPLASLLHAHCAPQSVDGPLARRLLGGPGRALSFAAGPVSAASSRHRHDTVSLRAFPPTRTLHRSRSWRCLLWNHSRDSPLCLQTLASLFSQVTAVDIHWETTPPVCPSDAGDAAADVRRRGAAPPPTASRAARAQLRPARRLSTAAAAAAPLPAAAAAGSDGDDDRGCRCDPFLPLLSSHAQQQRRRRIRLARNLLLLLLFRLRRR